MKKFILNIKNLEATIGDTQILKNFNLKIEKNEIHVIMGPNGSGKSTLAKVLTGHPSYKITNGDINFLGENIKSLLPEERCHKGLFLAFQHPIEIQGITTSEFLRTAYNQKRKFEEKQEVTPLEFTSIIKKLMKRLKIENSFLLRDLNDGFSGGEKKRNEILQMLLLQPKLAILDEIDSGVDIDALKVISKNILERKKTNIKFSALLITHYPKLLEYLKPDYIHVMINGSIICSGGNEIVRKIEKYGYNVFLKN